MVKYKVTRIWEVDVIDVGDALAKTKDWYHKKVEVERLE